MSNSTDERLDRANVLAPPPFIFLGAFAVGLLLQALWPEQLFADTVAVRMFGGVLVLVGLTLSTLVVRHFRRTGTPVSPRYASRQLVVSGPYRFSRNPDYVGQAVVVVGLGLLVDMPWVLMATIASLADVRYGRAPAEGKESDVRPGE